jgi:hypothetical protein
MINNLNMRRSQLFVRYRVSSVEAQFSSHASYFGDYAELGALL